MVIVRLHVTDCTEGYTVYASLINSDDVISGVNGPEYDDGDILGQTMFTIGADGSGGDAFFSIGSSFDPVEVPEWENYDVLLMIDSNDNFDLSTFTGASDEGDSNGWLSNQTLIDSTIISISITDPPENLEIVTY